MASASQSNEEQRPLKSLLSNEFSLVTFVNTTGRRASIYWLDYNGQRVRYRVLDPGGEMPITTFVTHPWMFRDADTGDLLVTNEDEDVFFPKASDFGSPQPRVCICIPVYSLYSSCIQAVRRLKTSCEVESLNIPQEVKQDLLSVESVPYKVHMAF